MDGCHGILLREGERSFDQRWYWILAKDSHQPHRIVIELAFSTEV